MSTSEGSRKSGIGNSQGASLRILGSHLRSLFPLPCSLFPLLVYCLLIPTHRSQARSLYEIREVKPGVFVLIPEDVVDGDGDPQFSRAGVAGFVVTREGAVVVNTMNTPFRARELLYEIRRRTELPVRYVINTDAHPDLTLGNEVFVGRECTIISTHDAADEMRAYRADLARRLALDENWRLQGRMRGIHPTPPTQTFDAQMTILLGGEKIQITRLSGGHSAGDAVVYVPSQKVLFLGHLFENGFFPRLASGDVRRWIEVLRQVDSWDVHVYVPAHGGPGDKKQLAAFRQFLEWLWNEVTTRVQEGKTLVDVKRELNPAETYRWRARELVPRALEEVYRQVSQEHQASASPGDESSSPAPRSR